MGPEFRTYEPAGSMKGLGHVEVVGGMVVPGAMVIQIEERYNPGPVWTGVSRHGMIVAVVRRNDRRLRRIDVVWSPWAASTVQGRPRPW